MEMETVILSTHTPELFSAAVQRAAAVLRDGGLAALPTETVYGLAANAFNARAVARIFEVKGRPAHNPIIVHVADSAMARRCVEHWPALADRLEKAFWPGPLTLVLRKADGVPDIVTAGGPTVGIRWPSHPIMQAVIRACGFPLAAPSANLSNQVSPTNAAHVYKHLKGRIPLILDGGQSNVGIESTVLDVTGNPPRVLRPGMIHSSALLALTGSLQAGAETEEGALKSPGMLAKHYSPRAPLLVRKWNDEETLRQLIQKAGSPGKIAVLAHTAIPGATDIFRVAVLPRDARAYARALYAELHQCDDSAVDLILVEELPEGAEWKAIHDRLRRAASK